MAGRKSRRKPTAAPKSFSMSRQVLVQMWTCFLAALLPLPLLAWIFLGLELPWNSVFCLSLALVAIFLALHLERIRFNRIEMGPLGLSFFQRARPAVFLKWGEIAHVWKDGLYRKALILSDKDRMLRVFVDLRLEGYDHIIETIFEKLEKRMPQPKLPLSFARAFRSVIVSEGGVLSRGPLHRRSISWGEIERVEVGYFYFFARVLRYPFVKLVLKDGDFERIYTGDSTTADMYLVLRKAFRRLGRPSGKAPVPHAFGEKPGRGWLKAFAAGALLATFPGFFLGQVLGRMGESPLWLLLGLLLLPAFLFFFLVLVSLREARIPAEPALEKRTALTAVLVWLVLGFLATAYFWRFTGDFALDHARKAVAKAGYGTGLPQKAPKLADAQNAAYFLRKAVEVKSGETLFSKDPNVPAFDLPFYGKKNQHQFLLQFKEGMREGRLTDDEVLYGSKLVSLHTETLGLVDKAFERKAADWGMDYKAVLSGREQAPEVASYMSLARLLACRAVLQARQGKGPDALATLSKGFFLAQVVEDGRFLNEVMVATAIRRLMLDAARWVLPRVDARRAKSVLGASLESGESLRPFLDAMQIELFGRMDWPAGMGWGDFSRSWGSGSLEASALEDLLVRSFGLAYWPFVTLDLSASCRISRERMDLYPLSYPRMRAVWTRTLSAESRKAWLLGRLALPSSSMDSPYGRLLEGVASSRVAQTAIESRIHLWKTDKWPNSVADLEGGEKAYLDPFTDGQPLKLVKKDGGLLIYSVGVDGKDEGGKLPGEEGEKDDVSWFVKPPPGIAPKN